MEINRTNSKPNVAGLAIADPNKADKSKKSKDAAQNSSVKGSGKDFDVQLSSNARDKEVARQKALDIARATPSIRQDRVAELKAQIKDGTYKPDAGKIADGMLREAIKDHLAISDR